jgi:hypothetical protein
MIRKSPERTEILEIRKKEREKKHFTLRPSAGSEMKPVT